MGDLRNVLNGLNGIVDVDNTPKDQSVTTAEEARNENEIINYQCGEHVACIWADDVGNNINWHLGVVDRYDHDTNNLFVSYMRRTDAKGTQWLFPEEGEITSHT